MSTFIPLVQFVCFEHFLNAFLSFSILLSYWFCNGRSQNHETQYQNKVWYIEIYTTYEHIYLLSSLWWFWTIHDLIFLLLDSYELSGFSMEGQEISKRNVIIKFDILKLTPLMSTFIPLIPISDFEHFLKSFSSFAILLTYRFFQWNVT